MSIKFACPGCGGVLEADEASAGAEASCPDCGSAFLIPDLPPAAPAAMAAAGGGLRMKASSHSSAPAASAPAAAAGGKKCPICGTPSGNPDAAVCLTCGYRYDGKRAGGDKKSAGGFGRGLIAGSAVALLLLLLEYWFFNKVGFTIFIFILIGGALIGLAVRVASKELSPRMGMAAALLTLGLVIVGQVLQVSKEIAVARELNEVYTCRSVFENGIHPERVSPLRLAYEESFLGLDEGFGFMDIFFSLTVIGIRNNLEKKSRSYASLSEDELLRKRWDSIYGILANYAYFHFNDYDYETDMTERVRGLSMPELEELGRGYYNSLADDEDEWFATNWIWHIKALGISFVVWTMLGVSTAWGTAGGRSRG